ncbi:MAG TPA: hypothetical protein VNS79_09505 [Sphingobium sp.]|nr:hypothetical protein [Sphingobium sp.]
MRKTLLGSAIALGLFAAATPAFAQGQCSRADLQKVVDGYIAAQTTGDAGKLPMGQWVQYTEQLDPSASMSTGILSKPQKIDFHRSFLDPVNCSTFTEAIITDPAHPYVLGTVLSVRGGAANAVDTLVTDADDWLFNAANTLKYSKAENWSEIPVADRDSRETLIAAANAYLDYFSDTSVKVPWGSPCARLEGGLYTAKGGPGEASPQDSCDVGVPADTKLVDRRYIVDDTLGAVAVLLTFGKNELPDIHSFRVEKGKIRYIHTITVCKTFNCGFEVPEQFRTSSSK